MASDKAYLDFILEKLSDLDGVTYRAMMGEYILYYRGRIFGGIYDDRFLVKITPSSERLLPDTEKEIPYDGAKEMLLADEVDNGQFLCQLVRSMYDELPEPKKRK